MKTDLINDYTNGFKPTKGNIAKLSAGILENVTEGRVGVDKQVTVLRALQEAIELTLENLKPLLVDELGKYSKGETCNVMGAKLELKEVGTKYDYSQCNDPVLIKLMEVKTDIDKQVKERQEWLRKLKSMAFVPDTETGELMEVVPPVKYSTTSYTISFPND
jgi:hypothetical protein